MVGFDKLKEAFGNSKDEEAAAPPPAYGESSHPKDEAAPEYSIPKLNPQAIGGQPSSSSSPSQGAAGCLFFPAKLTSRCSVTFRTYIGTSKDDRLHTVTPLKAFSEPYAILHTTADKKSPALATFGTLKGSGGLQSVIKVPPRPGGDRAEEVQVIMSGDHSSLHRFEMQVGQDRHTEAFEWRNSGGKEVRDLGQPRAFKGYKLVRMAIPNQGRGGERQDREWGFTSQGEEIVAIVAHTGTWTSGPEFAFLGTGLTGAFGETWEIVVVATWQRLMELVQQQAAAIGAGAA